MSQEQSRWTKNVYSGSHHTVLPSNFSPQIARTHRQTCPHRVLSCRVQSYRIASHRIGVTFVVSHRPRPAPAPDRCPTVPCGVENISRRVMPRCPCGIPRTHVGEGIAARTGGGGKRNTLGKLPEIIPWRKRVLLIEPQANTKIYISDHRPLNTQIQTSMIQRISDLYIPRVRYNKQLYTPSFLCVH